MLKNRLFMVDTKKPRVYIETMTTTARHLDDPKTWLEVLLSAAALGVQDAVHRKARTEKQLLAFLKAEQPFGYRLGHAEYLRRAYGAGYKGVKLTEAVQQQAALQTT
jgi:hypothetical protein